jgi:hypothetical protein
MHNHHHDSHDFGSIYLIAAIAIFVTLMLSAYSTPNNPFNLVLTAAPSSVVQVGLCS